MIQKVYLKITNYLMSYLVRVASKNRNRTLREKFPNREFFLVRIFPYLN